MAQVEILVGSKSDLPYLRSSDFIEGLEMAGVSYAISACSAHRNLLDTEAWEGLATRINATLGHTAVYVCAAGWAAALPGTVRGLLLGRSLATVFGIALPSEQYPDGTDAEISITRLPPGIDVRYGGVGTDGFNAITADVVELVYAYNPDPDPAELKAVLAKIKPPQFDIDPREI